MKNGEKRTSDVAALLLPYTKALVRCVTGLLSAISHTFEQYYHEAKEDMMVGQIEQFESKPVRYQIKKVWDLLRPVLDG